MTDKLYKIKKITWNVKRPECEWNAVLYSFIPVDFTIVRLSNDDFVLIETTYLHNSYVGKDAPSHIVTLHKSEREAKNEANHRLAVRLQPTYLQEVEI